MTFGHAIEALKYGQKVARRGWNGKGMWLLMVEGNDGVNVGYEINDHTVDGYRVLPWIGMKTADNKFVPWLASQTDMLSDDWGVVE